MVFYILALLSFFLSEVLAYSAVFNIASGDVPSLIAAINAANANGEENTITLAPGQYTLTIVDNVTDGANGLPSITGTMTLQGPEGGGAIIERDSGAPSFRLFHVNTSGNLSLKWLGVRGGGSVFCGDPSGICNSGGAIFGRGTVNIFGNTINNNHITGLRAAGGAIFSLQGSLTISRSNILNNSCVEGDGGGIASRSGSLIIEDSLISKNSCDSGGGLSVADGVIRRTTISGNTTTHGGGGGIAITGGQVTIEKTTIDGNSNAGSLTLGAGILNGGTLTLVSSTVSRNVTSAVNPDPGAGIYNTGTALILNSTISQNENRFGGIGGLKNDGTVRLQNTIVAGNISTRFSSSRPSDCDSVISLGNNLIGDPTGCTIALQVSDRTGDAGLAGFIDDGAPGHGRYPLLKTSPAINAGNDAACAPTDQLNTPRLETCDIGAVEFYPVVNDLVGLNNVSTDFDPTPAADAPAGTFHITAAFTNNSGQTILHPFTEVTELTNGDLLNANGGSGGVGARLRFPDADSPFLPGTTQTLEFSIGLQARDPFKFFVNVLGDSESSN